MATNDKYVISDAERAISAATREATQVWKFRCLCGSRGLVICDDPEVDDITCYYGHSLTLGDVSQEF